MAQTTVRLTLSIDWDALRLQKEWVLDRLMLADIEVSDDVLNRLEGLVALLDELQDQSVDTGQASDREVFGDEYAEWVDGQRMASVTDANDPKETKPAAPLTQEILERFCEMPETEGGSYD